MKSLILRNLMLPQANHFIFYIRFIESTKEH